MHTSSIEINNEKLKDIYRMNLSYLLLCQRLIREDKSVAQYHLGITNDVMSKLITLSLPQLLNLSSINQLIFRLHIESEKVIEILTRDSRIEALQPVHAGIILTNNHLTSLS